MYLLQTEEQLKKRVGAKLEVAKFLQDTVSEMAKDMRSSKTGAAQASAADLYQFMKRVSLFPLLPPAFSLLFFVAWPFHE